MSDGTEDWREHQHITELIVTEIFQKGKGDPGYLVPGRIHILKSVHPTFAQLNGPTFYTLYKRAAAEYILHLDREAVSQPIVLLFNEKFPVTHTFFLAQSSESWESRKTSCKTNYAKENNQTKYNKANLLSQANTPKQSTINKHFNKHLYY